MLLLRLLTLLGLFATLLSAGQTAKIGVLAKRSEARALQKWSPTALYLSEHIAGYRFEIVPLGFEALRQSVEHGDIDFVLTNTMYYVALEYDFGVSRIATLKNQSSLQKALTEYGGVVFTRQSSGIKTLEELENKRFGAVDPESFGGWVMARHTLKQNGIDPDDLSAVRFFGSHDAVVTAVKSGEVDAGTVRTDTLERMVGEGKIDLTFCRVLAPRHYPDFPYLISTDLYPEWPFAKLHATSEQLANRVAVALLQMPADVEAARAAHLEGWTIPLDYAKVHHLLEAMQIGPYAERGQLTLARFYRKYRGWFYGVAFGFLGVIAVLTVISRLNLRLREKQAEITALNAGLEQKVRERTEALATLYDHERYLKETLRAVADVNESLIASLSMRSMLHIGVAKLAEHPYYGCVWIGLPGQKILEAGMENGSGDIVYERMLYQTAAEQNPAVFAAVSAVIESNHGVTDDAPRPYRLTLAQARYVEAACHTATLPLRGAEEHKALGCLTVCSKRDGGFMPEELKMLKNLAGAIGMALQTMVQRTALEKLEEERIANYEETILAFVNIIEQRDSYTAGHTVRVAKYCRLIAEAMGIETSQIAQLEKAAILHDIGKVVTPDAVLLKPGKLTSLEYELIKLHAEAGYRMLAQIDMYRDLAQIIRYHHVHYDGGGYPDTSEGKIVPMVSYVMAVADAFDAMTTNRVYKHRKSVAEAIAELEAYAGTQFHPEVTAAAVRVLSDVQIEQTTQMPGNSLEQQRFAYFFQDGLTGAYNEDYLHTQLIQHEDERRCLNLIELKNFSAYNKQFGWDEGNRVLVCFADMLRERYSEAMLFRYHGDNFIVLFGTHQDVDPEELARTDVLSGSGIGIEIEHFDLKDGVPAL